MASGWGLPSMAVCCKYSSAPKTNHWVRVSVTFPVTPRQTDLLQRCSIERCVSLCIFARPLLIRILPLLLVGILPLLLVGILLLLLIGLLPIVLWLLLRIRGPLTCQWGFGDDGLGVWARKGRIKVHGGIAVVGDRLWHLDVVLVRHQGWE